jgi:Glycosyl hydrolase family 9
MLGAVYGKAVKQRWPAKSKRYVCWAKGQMRYMLGDVSDSFVVGFGPQGTTYPRRAQDRGASCPDPPAPCNAITGLYNPDVSALQCCSLLDCCGDCSPIGAHTSSRTSCPCSAVHPLQRARSA